MKCFDRVLQSFDSLLKDNYRSGFSLPRFDASLISDLINCSIVTLSKQSTLIRINGPTTIVGDIHGNIHDLLRILRKFTGFKRGEHILFLGDYVDRGLHSIEVIVLLLALVCKYPNNVFLLRGNHEFPQINRSYGFYGDIIAAYRTATLWDKFNEMFSWLPLAAVVSSSIFCVHGGLSPEMKSLADIDVIDKPVGDYDDMELVSDLVWSDPSESVSMFAESHRGCGVLFGANAIKNFFMRNNLKLMVRAHQCVSGGYSTFAEGTGITVFSSSEYCRIKHNKCGVIYVTGKSKIDIFASDSSGSGFGQPKLSMSLNPDLGLRKESENMDMSPMSYKTRVLDASPMSPKMRSPMSPRMKSMDLSPMSKTRSVDVSPVMGKTRQNVSQNGRYAPSSPCSSAHQTKISSPRFTASSPRASTKTCSPSMCKTGSPMFTRTSQSPRISLYPSSCRRDH